MNNTTIATVLPSLLQRRLLLLQPRRYLSPIRRFHRQHHLSSSLTNLLLRGDLLVTPPPELSSPSTTRSNTTMSSSPSSLISATATNSTSRRISCVLLNAARLNYDSRISFDKLEAIPCDSGASSGSGSIGKEGKQREQEDNNNEFKSMMTVQYYDKTDPKDVVERVNTATVVVNKEMPLTYEMITQFSSSVRLIVEAGTGYNNINLQACSERGIAVCNVPTYATEAMAHMVITYLMTFACSLPAQIHALAHNDRTYLQQCHLGTLPHFELTSKRLGLIGGLGTIVSCCCVVWLSL